MIKADALITAINSEGAWFGGIDRVINRYAGGQFHLQAQAKMPLSDCETVVAKGGSNNKAAFSNVVFVVDDLKQRLRNVILSGLTAATEAGLKSVTLPTIRMGVMLGQVEDTAEEALTEIVIGVKSFIDDNPGALESITFVVYNDAKVKAMLEGQFQHA